MRDGAIRHVRGDRSHPVSRGQLCRKCATAYNGVFLDPNARLTEPLRRNGPKGGGAFARGLVGRGDRRGRRAGWARSPPRGPATILNAHYTGTFALLGYALPDALLRPRSARREVDPDTICNKAGHVALGLPVRDLAGRLRPAHRARRALHPGVGRQPVGIGPAPVTSTGCPRRRRKVIVVDSLRDRDRAPGRPAPAAVPRHRRRARVRASLHVLAP